MVIAHPECVVHAVGDLQGLSVLIRVADDGNARHEAEAAEESNPTRTQQTRTVREASFHSFPQTVELCELMAHEL